MVSAIARLPVGLHHGSAQSTRFSCEIKLINPEYYATACIFVDYGYKKRSSQLRNASTGLREPNSNNHDKTSRCFALRYARTMTFAEFQRTRTQKRSSAELWAFWAENFVSIVKTAWSRFVAFYILCEWRIDQGWLWSIWNNRRGFYEILRDNWQTVNNSYKIEHNEKTMRKREFLAS